MQKIFKKIILNKVTALLAVLAVTAISYLFFYNCIPSNFCMSDFDVKQGKDVNMPFVFISDNDTLKTASDSSSINASGIPNITADARLFGVWPVKKVNIHILPDAKYIPSGQAFGVKLYTDGVVVVGLSDIESKSGSFSPAGKAGIRPKDVVLSINDKKIKSNDELSSIVESEGAGGLDFKIRRDSEDINISVTPVMENTTDKYKIGMWIRDSTAGIGTMTFYSKEQGFFAGLGHGICDVDTGDIMPLLDGTVAMGNITGVIKGSKGSPGELKGQYIGDKVFGKLLNNSSSGIYGLTDPDAVFNENEPLSIAFKNEIKAGPATILSTIDGDTVAEYKIEIVNVFNSSPQNKDMMIKVTDERLLELTGGIVQGMSGSPIIQNGKLVGAVTHVLVNDPSKGFGIFAENMLISIQENLEKVA